VITPENMTTIVDLGIREMKPVMLYDFIVGNQYPLGEYTLVGDDDNEQRDYQRVIA